MGVTKGSSYLSSVLFMSNMAMWTKTILQIKDQTTGERCVCLGVAVEAKLHHKSFG